MHANLTCLLPDFTSFYRQEHHLVLVPIVCGFGLACHSLVVLVITRKMLFNANNLIMLVLSLAQASVLLGNLVQNKLTEWADTDCLPRYWGAGWTTLYYYAHITQVVGHSMAAWTTVALSVTRAVSMTEHNRQRKGNWLTYQKASISLCICAAIVLCTALPANVTLQVQLDNSSIAFSHPHCYDVHNPNWTVVDKYYLTDNVLGRSVTYQRIVSRVFPISCKFVPCCVVVVCSLVLARQIMHIQTNSSRFRAMKSGIMAVRHRQLTRSCRMVIFTLTEAPSSVLVIYWSLGASYADGLAMCYGMLVALMQVCFLIANSVNFALFCYMSEQFRGSIRALLPQLGSWHRNDPTVTTSRTNATNKSHNNEEELMQLSRAERSALITLDKENLTIHRKWKPKSEPTENRRFRNLPSSDQVLEEQSVL